MKKYLVGTAILGGIGLFAYSIYRYVKVQSDLLKNFQWKILDFGMKNFDYQTIKGTLKMLFTSTSDIEVVIKEFYVDFFFNGMKVGYIQDMSEFVIPANGSTTIPFEYTLNPQLVLTNIADIVGYVTKEKDASIKVIGYATVKSGFIKVTLPIEYDTMVSELLA